MNDDVMSDELPTGWGTCLIGEISPVVGGGTPPSKDTSNFTQEGGIPWLTPADLSGYREIYIARGARNLTDKGFSESSAKMLPKGALLFSSRAPVGYVAIASNPVCTNQGFKSFVLPEGFDSRFGYFYLRHIKPLAESMATGTTFKELSGGTAAQLPFLIAPLAEQKRIADKLEAVLGRVDACRARLDRVPDLLKRFRQSVLAAATSGQLTVDWREKNKVSGEWQYLPLGDVAHNHDGKRVPISEDKRKQRSGNYPYYGAAGVIDRIDGYTHDGKFLMIGEDGANLLTRSKPNAFIASGKIWVNNHAHVLSCIGGAPEEFLAHFINSISLDPYVSGSAQPKLNQKNLNRIEVPQPTIPEQAEIVRRVEALFSMADRIEARLTAARAQVERLTPATLSKAFRGDLVPQDPNDEPASKLLERLATTRPSMQPRKRSANRG